MTKIYEQSAVLDNGTKITSHYDINDIDDYYKLRLMAKDGYGPLFIGHDYEDDGCWGQITI